MIIKRQFTSLGLFVAMLIGMMAPASWAQAPQISATSPQAVEPGKTTDVTLKGSNLAGVIQLWTSFNAKTELAPNIKGNGTNATQVVFRVTVPKETTPGIHAIRVVTSKGVSSMKLFVVDDLATVAKKGGNTSPSTAQLVNVPVAIDGTLAALTQDYYRFKAEAGQTISFEVLGRRIGSPLDPVIRILTMTDFGPTEIAYSDDALGLMGDAQFSHKFKSAGEYLVEVRDVRYQGGGNHRYRLRIGDFPCVNTPYPMNVKRGAKTTLNFAGTDVANVVPVAFQAPQSDQIAAVPVAARRKGGQSSGFAVVTLGPADHIDALEKEPNDSIEKATSVPTGASLNGIFNKRGDVDSFAFTAKKGQRFTFKAITRSHNSPVDLTLRLLNAKGAKLAEAEDSGTNDGVLTYTFPADGKYILAVEDLHQRGGSEFGYRVQVSPASQGFTLLPNTDHVNIPAGGTAWIQVKSTRQGYNGPIALKATGLPKGVTSVPTVIGPGRNSVVMTFTAEPGVKPFPISGIRIVGTGTVGKTTIQSSADLSVPLRANASGLPWPSKTLLNQFAVAIGPPAPMSLRTSVSSVTVAKGKTVKFKVTVKRGPAITEAITVGLTPVPKKNPDKAGLPAGLTIAAKPIPKGKNEVELVISASAKAPKGTFTATLVGTHKKGKATIQQNVPGIIITVQ